MSTMKIISYGTADGTVVIGADGKPMTNVLAAYILMEAGKEPCALLKVCDIEVEIEVSDVVIETTETDAVE